MNWHDTHLAASDFGDRLADAIAGFIGSWRFIVLQTIIFIVWIVINTVLYFSQIQFDPYPYILFNLLMSAEAAFSGPLVMMSQNRQADRDRHQAEMDYTTNLRAKEEIEELQSDLARIENEKLDFIIRENEKLDQIMDEIQNIKRTFFIP